MKSVSDILHVTSRHDTSNAFISVLLIKNSTSKKKASRSLYIVYGIDDHIHKSLAKKSVGLHRKKRIIL